MSEYIAIDAGGSKCAGLRFTGGLELVASAQTGGVNTTQNAPEESRRNMADCLDALLRSRAREALAGAYVSIVGPMDVFCELLFARAPGTPVIQMSEPVAGLWAGAMASEGILALAGTGSDVFWISERAPRGRRLTVGSWGPILGDQGSGTWIGTEALRAAVACSEGWGEETLILPLLRERWALAKDYDLVERVHKSAAPFRTAASATRVVGEAAAMGDALALRIVGEAGRLMAVQTICLMEREGARGEVVCCGGAWKTHPAMFEAFSRALAAFDAAVVPRKPWFEHVLAGPCHLAAKGRSREEARALVLERFPEYQIRW